MRLGGTRATISARIAALMVAAVFLAGCVASSGDNPSPSASTASYTDSDGPPAAARSSAAATRTAATPAAASTPVAAQPVSLPAGEAAAVSAMTAVSTPGSDGYRVGPLDVLNITVFKVDDLTKTVQVSESGSFAFPLVGDIPAAGRTVSEIERDLAAKLGGNYLRNPQVTVLVKEYNSHRITVDGAVNKPGVFPMQGPMSLLQSIAMAGGMQEVAEGTILVFRRVDGKTAVAKFSVADLRSQKASDPDLQAGDIVTVPSSDLKIGMRYIFQSVPLFNAFMLL